MPARCSTRYSSVSVMLSGCTGQPGRLTIGMPSRESQFQPEVVAQAHRAGRVVAHRRDPAVGGARAEREHGRGPGREPVDPRVGRGSAGRSRGRRRSRPVALAVDLLVGDRALEHEDERIELAGGGAIPRAHELLAGLVGEHRVERITGGIPGRQPRSRSSRLGLRGRGHRDRVAVAAEPAGQPQHVTGSRRELAARRRWSERGARDHRRTDGRCRDERWRPAARGRSISDSRWSSRLPCRCSHRSLPVTSPAARAAPGRARPTAARPPRAGRAAGG